MNDDILYKEFQKIDQKLDTIKDNIGKVDTNTQILQTIVIGKDNKSHEKRIDWLEDNHFLSPKMLKHKLAEKILSATIIGTIITGFGVLGKFLQLF